MRYELIKSVHERVRLIFDTLQNQVLDHHIINIVRFRNKDSGTPWLECNSDHLAAALLCCREHFIDHVVLSVTIR
jgi:hypothetical protein